MLIECDCSHEYDTDLFDECPICESQYFEDGFDKDEKDTVDDEDNYVYCEECKEWYDATLSPHCPRCLYDE